MKTVITIKNMQPQMKHLQPSTQITSHLKSTAQIVENGNSGSNEMTFSQVLKRKKKTKPLQQSHAIVIKPKEINQDNNTTIQAIRGNINSSEINARRIKNAKNCGIIVECKSKEASELLVKKAKSKIGGDYDIKIPQKLLPKIRMFGMFGMFGTHRMKSKTSLNHKIRTL